MLLANGSGLSPGAARKNWQKTIGHGSIPVRGPAATRSTPARDGGVPTAVLKARRANAGITVR